MDVKGAIVLVTGANRGIGTAFVQEALDRGAARVYAAARDPASLAGLWTDKRVVPLKLDVTDAGQIADVVARARDVTLVINNAGVASDHGAISAPDLSAARQEMEVNYFAPLAISRAFAPILAAAGGGAIINVLSFLSLVTMPRAGTYSASKAAGLALTRSLRAELAAQGTHVVATMPVQVETAMGASLPEPRLAPREVASETLDAVESGAEEVFPGELTRNVAAAYARDPKGVQAQVSLALPSRA